MNLKYFKITFLLVTVLSSVSYSQKISFDENSKAKINIPYKGKRIEVTPPVKWMLDTLNIVTLNNSRDSKCKENIEKVLAQINNTIFNLADTGLQLKNQYDAVFGKGIFDTLQVELLSLKNTLKSNDSKDTTKYKLIPSKQDIDTLLKSCSSAVKIDTPNTADGYGYQRYRLLEKDIYREWLNSRSDTLLKSSRFRNLDSLEEYRRSWLELERMLPRLQVLYNNTYAFCDSVGLCPIETILKQIKDEVCNLKKALEKNIVYSWLKHANGYSYMAQWLWYTGGQIRINPLGYFDEKMAYNSNDPNKYLDSTRSAELKTRYGTPYQKKLSSAGVILNDLILPIKQKEKKGRQSLYFIYDADKINQSNRIKSLQRTAGISEGSSVDVIVFNNSKTDSLSIDIRSATNTGEGRFSDGLGSVANELSGVVALLSPALGPMALVTSRLNASAKSFPSAALIPYQPDIEIDKQLNIVRDNLEKFNNENILDQKNECDNVKVKTLDEKSNRIVPLSGDQTKDKERILFASLKKTCEGAHTENCYCDTEAAMWVADFIKSDFCFDLDYDCNQIKNSAENLVNRFKSCNKKRKDIEIRCKEVKYEIESLAKIVNEYLRIYDRHFPKNDLLKLKLAYESNNQTLTTKIKQASDVKDKTDVVYTITKSVMPDPSMPSDITPLKVTATNKIGVSKPKSFGVSAGVANTFGDYLVSTTEGNGLPVFKQADKLRFMFALHWYPWKLLNVDDGFIPKRNPMRRISIMAGMSLPKSLENIYVGIGYDLVPGLVISGGAHFPWVTRFEIVNNQVVSQASGFRSPLVFASLSIKPSALLSSLNIIGK